MGEDVSNPTISYVGTTVLKYTIRAVASHLNTFVTISGNSVGRKDCNVSASGFAEADVTPTDTVIVTSTVPVYVYVVAVTNYIGFATTIPAESHFSSKYYFQVPLATNSYNGSYANIILKSGNINSVYLNGNKIASNITQVKTTRIGSDLYTVISIPIAPGNHLVENVMEEKMGLIVYGYNRSPYSSRTSVLTGFGYVGGLNLT